MLRVANDDLERMLFAVMSARARLRVFHDLSVAEPHIGPTLLVAAAPAAKADHLVVRSPFGKRVVRCVNDHQRSAVTHIIDERLLGRLTPLVSVVVADDRLIVGELRREAAHVFSLLGRCGDLDLVKARVGEMLAEHRRGGFPSVVVLTIDDQHAIRRRGLDDCGEQHDQSSNNEAMHDASPIGGELRLIRELV